jgi:hypothetical protein
MLTVRTMLALIALLLSVSSSSHALKISEYLVMKENPQQKTFIDVYLKGYIHGLFNANDVLEARGELPLFCMPDADRFLSKGNHTEYLDLVLSKSVTYVKDDTTIEIALVSTLVNTYPCKKSTPVKKK